MLELCVVQETAKTLKQFKGEKCRTGVKPLLSFSGTLFDSPTSNEYTLAKSMFVDCFRGAEVREIDVEGLQLLISFSVGESRSEEEKPQIHMRCWRIITKRSGQKVPKVDVEEIGPRIDFRIGRMKGADASKWKDALKKAKHSEVSLLGSTQMWQMLRCHNSQAKTTKNVETDLVGDKMGRIHVGKQDLKELQTRKMKGLKRERIPMEDDDMGETSIVSENDSGSDGGVAIKRQKLRT